MSEDYTKLKRLLRKTRTKNDPKLARRTPSKKDLHAYHGRLKIMALIQRGLDTHQRPNPMKSLAFGIKRAIYDK